MPGHRCHLWWSAVCGLYVFGVLWGFGGGGSGGFVGFFFLLLGGIVGASHLGLFGVAWCLLGRLFKPPGAFWVGACLCGAFWGWLGGLFGAWGRGGVGNLFGHLSDFLLSSFRFFSA